MCFGHISVKLAALMLFQLHVLSDSVSLFTSTRMQRPSHLLLIFEKKIVSKMNLREETHLTEMNEKHAEELRQQLVRKLYFAAISVGC